MYKVLTYEVKTGMLGVNMQKADLKMENFLNDMEKDGWQLISLSEMDTNSKSFVYKMVFKKV